MRDVIAGVFALVLTFAAISLATRLKWFRQSRDRARDAERALGRRIIAEIPAAEDLTLFTEDAARFYYGDRSIDKDLIVEAQVLVNGSPITRSASDRGVRPSTTLAPPILPEVGDETEGILRDRWDVMIHSVNGAILIECGAIRERVSQELARTVFEAVAREIERRNATVSSPRGPSAHHSDSGAPAR
jgi:hypothetical protein